MLGRNRVALGMGHFNLEEPGMEYMLEYLDDDKVNIYLRGLNNQETIMNI